VRAASTGLLTVAGVFLGIALAFSGCTTVSGLSFAEQQTCGPNPPTAWRYECTFIALGVSSAAVIGGFLLRGRRRELGAVLAILLALASMFASFVGWVLPVFASALC
jgi:hypothetical protein